VDNGHASFAGITNSFSYNQRLQPINMSAMSPSATVFSLNYDFHLSAGDNGNVFGITNNKDTSRNQTFTYDALNRLVSAQNAGTDCSQKTLNSNQTKFWGNNYSYDAWGNLLTKSPTKCSAENLNNSADPQNRAHPTSGPDYQYDAAGNMTKDNLSQSYTYDPENRITGAPGYTYGYDADGNRVEKSTGGSSPTGTLYWYMTPGIVAESDLAGNLQSEYVFFDGERVARKDLPSNAVSYYFSDQLKTASVITNSARNIKSESDYYPWGGELSFIANDSNHYKFTGKERDTETQLDYFGARYYSNALGRFISTDPGPYIRSDPQTWNRYAYTRNNPHKYIDPDGRYFVVAADQRVQVTQYISTLLRTPQGRATVSAIAADSRPTYVGGGNLPRRNNPNGTISLTLGTTTLIPGQVTGVASTNVTLDQSNIAVAANATGNTAFRQGLVAFDHELNHVNDVNAAPTLQEAAAANAAGDAATRPGANNTTGGTAEAGALATAAALGVDANSYTPNGKTDGEAEAIVQMGIDQETERAQRGLGMPTRPKLDQVVPRDPEMN
jgi:RHS repeat-associated protein